MIETAPTAAAPALRVLGSTVHLVSVAQVADRIERWINVPDGQCHRVVVTGFHGLWEAHQDSQLGAILNTADIWAPDGIAPVWAARLRGHRNVQRTPGMDIMREFFQRANAKHYASYFYGDTEVTLAALRQKLVRDNPGHRIAGTFSPPFRPLTPHEDEEIVARINAARPHVLWVGLGMPKQDWWIHERVHRLRVPVAIGVGAAFAFLAGTVRRCPDSIGRFGFEWLYRFLREPRKLWRRDLVDGPLFLLHLGMDLAGLHRDR
jgi:N-acetylglucosaminyldiphosphoundecaprenol N-acetyl-beta-D-mannosaminyltransferase